MNAFETAHRMGRLACAEAKPKSTNQFAPDAPEHAEWLRGWQTEFETLPDALKAARTAKEAA